MGLTYPDPLIEGILLRRYKRFLADVRLPDGREVVAHCPNPGSMRACWAPDIPCRVSPQDKPRRKLKWTLEQTCVAGAWIAVNTAHPNKVVEAAVAAGRIEALAGYPELAREVRYGEENSRIDLLLKGDDTAWVEVKNVTLREDDGVAYFPDSVSKRGTKHLRELILQREAGDRAVLFFHVGRGDVDRVRPAAHIDPTYAETLREAVAAGVEVLAYRCEVGPEGLRLSGELPVELWGGYAGQPSA